MAVVDRHFMTDGTGQAIAEGLNSVAEAISGGGGGGSTEPFFVTVTADSEGNVTADKTLSEIFTAINANKNVYMNWVNNSESAYSIGSANMIALDCYYTDSSLRLVNFYRYVIGDGDVTFMNVKIYDAEIVVTEQMLTSY